MIPSTGQSESAAQVVRRPLPEGPIGTKLQTIKDPGLSQARIKESGKVPIGRLRNKLPGVAPCTSLLREKGKGYQGEERWQGYAIHV
jgi:hypothetical protein